MKSERGRHARSAKMDHVIQKPATQSDQFGPQVAVESVGYDHASVRRSLDVGLGRRRWRHEVSGDSNTTCRRNRH